MSNVRRLYVEKKPAFAVRARELEAEIRNYLGISDVKGVRELIRYDMEHVSEKTYRKALVTVFSEPPVDDVYEENFELNGARTFSVEFLPGQFDQRADSAEQCVKLLNENEEPLIRTAVTYVIEGEISDTEFEAIKKHCINPVDSRETGLEKPQTLVQSFPEPEDVKIFDGFSAMPEAELKELYDSLGLAMTFKDFLHIQNYFKNEEKRDPSMTEIRVLDTYWSDHCRHTTFSTELKDVSFDDGYYRAPMEETYQDYLATHKNLYAGRSDKFVCLMDIALMAMKRLKKEGKLMDQEEYTQFQNLDDVVTVYRGVTSYNANNIKALSWTLNREVAEWFVHRYGEDGIVYEAQINKEHTYALFLGRNEEEVIVDPKRLINLVPSPSQEPVQGPDLSM